MSVPTDQSHHPPPTQEPQPDPEPGGDCDPGAIDEARCQAEGIKRLAELTAEYATGLETRNTAFDKARAEYATSRADAAVIVEETSTRLTYVIDQLECMLKPDVIECLKRAYAEVCAKLDECRGPVATGCCIDDDCEFSTDVEGVPTPDLVARIAEYERRATSAEACFDRLVTEPTELVPDANALKARVEALVGKLGDDPKTSDPKRTYVEARIVRRDLADIWGGFADTDEFIQCLCRALLCSVKGRQAIATLEAELAVRACREATEKARCEWLAEHVVDEVLAAYVRLCAPPPAENPTEEPPTKDCQTPEQTPQQPAS